MHDRLDHVRGWLRKADSDLKTALLIVSADGPYDTACYHAQQAVEKYLKALLALAADDPIPRTHNLEDLSRLCRQALPSWEPPEGDAWWSLRPSPSSHATISSSGPNVRRLKQRFAWPSR